MDLRERQTMEKGHSCCGCPRHTEASWWGCCPALLENIYHLQNSHPLPLMVYIENANCAMVCAGPGNWPILLGPGHRQYWLTRRGSTRKQQRHWLWGYATGAVCTVGSLRLQARGHSPLPSDLQVNLNNQTPFPSKGKGQISPSTVPMWSASGSYLLTTRFTPVQTARGR